MLDCTFKIRFPWNIQTAVDHWFLMNFSKLQTHERDDARWLSSKATCNRSVLPFLQPDVVIELLPVLRSKGWFDESRGTEHQHITGISMMSHRADPYRMTWYVWIFDIRLHLRIGGCWWLPAAVATIKSLKAFEPKQHPLKSFGGLSLPVQNNIDT